MIKSQNWPAFQVERRALDALQAKGRVKPRLRDLIATTGFELLKALDGAAGIAVAAEHRPDLIMMDI